MHRQLQLSDSAVETKQKQSVELLQLLDYSAVKRDALWFIESVTSAGQDNLDYYKDRRPWPENVARAHGNEELAPFQDVHTRYCVKCMWVTLKCIKAWLKKDNRLFFFTFNNCLV